MLKLPKYLRIDDEFEDALSSLELVTRLLPDTEQEPLLWKWIILGIHNGLQGAMVCALSGTDGLGALSTKSRRKILMWRDTGQGPRPEPRMALFGYLLHWACDPERVKNGLPLTPSDEELQDLDRLHRLRRNFAHFTPMGWSIETVGLPRIVLVALDAIERLTLHNDRVLAHLAGDREQRLIKSIASIRAILN